MNKADFLRVVDEAHKRQLEIMNVKGAAYSGSEDVFANFKRNAERLGLTQYQIWLVYFAKHIDAIFNAVKQNPGFPVDKSEGLEGRIDDAENYLKLLRGMLNEGRSGSLVTPPNQSYKFWNVEDHIDEMVAEDVEYKLAGTDLWYALGSVSRKSKFPAGTIFRRKLDRFEKS